MQPPARRPEGHARRPTVMVEGLRSTRARRATADRTAAGQHAGRRWSAATPFWITLGVAAVLAGGFVLSLAEPPPEKPAEVVLVVDGLR